MNRTVSLDVYKRQEPTGALQIALRARGTPRVANSLLRWVRDYAQVRGDGVITEQLAHDALTMICLLYTSVFDEIYYIIFVKCVWNSGCNSTYCITRYSISVSYTHLDVYKRQALASASIS